MLAEYDGFVYWANIQDDKVTLLTFDQTKVLNGFEAKRDYYKKNIALEDAMLVSLYEIHYWVTYKDSIESNELWLVDEGRSVGLFSRVENDEVTIDVSHDANDSSWMQYEKGAAAKIVKLGDCLEFYVEKIYVKKNERIINRTIEKTKVPLNVFKNSMMMNRRVNL